MDEHGPGCEGCRELAVVTAIQQIEHLCTDAHFYDGAGRKVVVADDIMAVIATLPGPYRSREWFPCGHRHPTRDVPCTQPTGHVGLHSHTGTYWSEPAAQLEIPPACDHCPHEPHNGLCLVLVDPPEIGQARCACTGRPPVKFARDYLIHT